MTIDWAAPSVVCNILWTVWYVTWIAAVVFSRRTTVQMDRSRGGWSRTIGGFGLIALFWPAGDGRPLFGVAGLGWFTGRLWLEPDDVAWTLVGLTVAGFAFCWWARLYLGRLWSGLPTIKEGHHIVDTGPYGLVRHPIYLGLMISAFMTAALHASPAAFCGVALITLGFSQVARLEEGFLRQELGADAYDAYARRVPMLVPRLF
jgi:protein-S-isoprenylcysteine O-methyltransferase Ste14